MTVSSLFIGLTGFFQTMGGYILLAMDPNISTCTSVFLMAFSVYSLNKLTDVKLRRRTPQQSCGACKAPSLG